MRSRGIHRPAAGYRNDAELQAWLARRPNEAALEAELPIIDPHHHFWDTPQRGRYLPELLEDIGGGHNIVATVFLECRSMYKKDGPAEMMPVGEVEFVKNHFQLVVLAIVIIPGLPALFEVIMALVRRKAPTPAIVGAEVRTLSAALTSDAKVA